MKNDIRVLNREEKDFLVGIDVSVAIVGDTNHDIGRRVMGEVIEIQNHVGYKGGIILLCEGEFNHTSPFDGEKEARADALRMAQVALSYIKKEIGTIKSYEGGHGSYAAGLDGVSAEEIIAKYEEK